MTNRKIKEHKNEVYRIVNEKDRKERQRLIIALANKIGAPLRGQTTAPQFIDDTIRSIHIVLQTEMMLNACGSAKWSCLWAAIAATVACISVVLTYMKT